MKMEKTGGKLQIGGKGGLNAAAAGGVEKGSALGARKMNIMLICASALLILLALFLFYSNMAAANENEKLKADYSSLNSELSKKISEKDAQITALNLHIAGLEKSYSSLEGEKKSVEVSKEEITGQYERLKTDINSTVSELERREKMIDESIDWFKANAALPESFGTRNKNKLWSMCFDIQEKYCSVNTACVNLVNEQYAALHYADDNKFDSSGDRLISIEEFLKRKRGDCEDFSLLYKAEFSHLLNECILVGAREFRMVAWTDDEDYESVTNDYFALDNARTWAIANVKSVSLRGYIYPNVVCGTIYDMQSEEVAGHCVVAFTKNRISGLDNLGTELAGAPMIEPQSGEFYGYINGDSSDYEGGEGSSPPSGHYIYMVITDDDLYQFDQIDGNWTNYANLKIRLNTDKMRLLELDGK